jgi:hypothetical protein
MYTPYITVYVVIALPKIPYIHLIFMVLANPKRKGSGKDEHVFTCTHVTHN